MENYRYDRQIRLWGDQGQISIGQASVCVLGSSSIASEILKNLVLAGIKSFHIIDDAKVSQPDLGQNFFIRDIDLGKLRAAVVTQLLLELNPAVKGTFSNESIENFTTYSSFLDFSVVISTNIFENDASLLSEYLVEHEVPFIYVRVCGMFGYLHLSYKQHIVWNSHTENSPYDFRLDFPFKELLELSDSIDLDNLTRDEHSHVPYLILYIKALEIWRSEERQTSNDNSSTAVPINYQQRKDFEKVLMNLRKPDKDGNFFEENFHEAKLNLFKSFEQNFQTFLTKLSSAFNDPKAGSLQTCKDYLLTTNNHLVILRPFWILTAALNEFANVHNYLPLSGQLPDMTSFSETYSKIATIFRTQANKEAYELYEITKNIFTDRLALIKSIYNNSTQGNFGVSGVNLVTPKDINFINFESSGITFDLCKQFCKNASKIQVLNGRSLKDEYACNMEDILQGLTKPILNEHQIYEVDPKVWAVLLRAMDRFFNEKDRFPGTNGVPCFIDSQDLRRRITSIFAETNNRELMAKEIVLVPPFFVEEICRYGASELHVISAIFGGIAAQEAIKLVTQQYIPLNNAIVFDGHTQNSKYI